MTLTGHLIALAEATQRAYDVAIAEDRNEVAGELVLLAHQTAALIAKALRGSLEKVS